MNDPLTAEERVTLNQLMRKQAEYHARTRLMLDTLCESHFYGKQRAEEVAERLILDADKFVAALKPFCKEPT